MYKCVNLMTDVRSHFLQDNGDEPKSNTTVLLVSVLDGEDLPPQFLPCNFSVGGTCEPVTYSVTILEKAVSRRWAHHVCPG